MRPLPAALFLLLLAVALSAPPPPPDDCPPASCSHLFNVSFPFWVEKLQSPSCGLPSFKLICDNQIPRIRISTSDYMVNNISYPNETLILSPLWRQSFPCRLLRNSFFLNATPFSLLSPRSSLFFHYNCSSTSTTSGYKLVDCGQKVNSIMGWNRVNHPVVCESVSTLPSVAQRGVDLGNWTEVLAIGFFFKWRAVDCTRCQLSGGKCRYNVEDKRFGCLCGDRLLLDSCKGQNRRQKIFIGVGTGIGGIIISSLVFFFLYKRKEAKMRPNGSKLLSWTNSSKLSSTKDLENGTDSVGAPFFRYEELHDATDGFNPSNELGDGGFGTVYKGKLRDGRIVAVKRLYENNYKRVEQFMNEAAILNRLRHPNLVSLYGCTSRHSRELLLVYEFVPNGTVADHLHGHLATRLDLNWPLRLRIALETATALSYLHAAEPQIIHRDIKTNNILLDANFHVKVADFGLSRLFPMDVTHVSTAPQGTPGYVDPEYHQCYQLTDKSDVYSFGVVLVELISSMPAVDITRRRNEINLSSMAVNKIQSGQLGELVDPRLGFDSDPEVRGMVEVVAELAFRCLQSEKEMRPSMEEAVEVLLGISDGGGKERETTEAMNKIDEVVLLKAMVPPLSPESVMHKWSSRVTTPNASE